MTNKATYAVYDFTTGFRYTDYTTRYRATIDLANILRDHPDLNGKIAVRTSSFEAECIFKK